MCIRDRRKGDPINLNVQSKGNLAEAVIPMILEQCGLKVLNYKPTMVVSPATDEAQTKQAIAEKQYTGTSLKARLVGEQLNRKLIAGGQMPVYSLLQMIQGQTGLTIECDFHKLGITGWEMVQIPTSASSNEILRQSLGSLGLQAYLKGMDIVVGTKQKMTEL